MSIPATAPTLPDNLPLHAAVEANDPALLEKALAAEPLRLNATDANDLTALGLAIRLRRFDLAGRLYQAGAAANYSTRAGTPLTQAIDAGYDWQELQKLEQHGLRLDAACAKNGTLLHHAALKDRVDLIPFLAQRIEVDAAANSDATALHIAVMHNHPAAALALLQHGADPLCAHADGKTALHDAARHNAFECALVLLDDARVRHNIDGLRDNDGATALHLAAFARERADIVRLLLRHGASPNATDKSGATPVHTAAQFAGGESLRLLLRAGGRPQARRDGGNLHVTPLHCTSIDPREAEEVIRLLVAAGADIEARDLSSRTPLHVAIENIGADKTALRVAALVAAGADVNATNLLKRRPLDLLIAGENVGYAPDTPQEAALLALIAGGADLTPGPNPPHKLPPLHHAIRRGTLAVVAAMIAAGADIHAPDLTPHARTPFQAACEAGNDRAVKLLRAAGADILATDARGQTALHLAAASGDIDTLQYLLSLGIYDLDARDHRNRTPLFIAVRDGRAEAAALLHAAGANPDLTDIKNSSARYIAARATDKKIKALFNDAARPAPAAAKPPAKPSGPRR